MKHLIKTRFLLAFLLVGVFCIGSTSPKASSADGVLDLEVQEFTLKNGLRLLVYENNLLPIVSFRTFVNLGSRHESAQEGTTGASHFLEHMMFKSSKKYPQVGTIDRLFANMGAINNAFTSRDQTVYVEDIPVEHLDELIEINADRMKNLVMVDEEFESERNVIFEERKESYENSPGRMLGLASMKEVFGGTPYGSSLIGSVEDLTNLTREQVFEFYRKFYTPDNMVIVVAGNVNAETIREKISNAYGDMLPASPDVVEYRKKLNEPQLYAHKATYDDRHIKIHGATPYPIFMMAYRGVPDETWESRLMEVLGYILFAGESSWFYQKYLKTDSPMVNYVSGYHHGLRMNGKFAVVGSLLPGVDMDKFKKQLITDTIQACDKKDVINERSLQKIKNQLMASYYGGFKTNGDIAQFLGSMESLYGDYRHYKKAIVDYRKMTVSQIRKVCRDTFKPNNHIFLSIWNNHPLTK